MKFTAAFAILAVFASKAVVSAAPAPIYESLQEARSEFIESALEEVWARFYDELLEVESRAYDDMDDFEAREYYDEDIFERSPMKKFTVDLITGIAQKAPKIAEQKRKTEEAKARQAEPRPAPVVPGAQGKAKPPTPMIASIPPTSKWNKVKQPSVVDQIRNMGKK
ncbi:hypothetical protein BKA70DRAFT_1406767 [Coprinopsis sp. MPI-PUGE-AT-0042]|nr:hypothetical protein BKA70DRAFT_1406767 [Coprinopsis sp. MPI-PUGE-AT-0042]